MAGSEFTLNFLTVKAKWKHLIKFTIKSVPTIKTEKHSKVPFFLVLKAEKYFSSRVYMEIKIVKCLLSLKKKKKNPAFLTTFLLLFLQPRHSLYSRPIHL